jgi:uncharacterized protein involved in exopolysaccharide biosynthesis
MPQEDTVSLLDLLLVVARQRNLILIVFSIITVSGLIYSFIAPIEYRSSARVVREVQMDAPSGISGGLSALRGLGISLGGASSGLSPESYPSILQSREVRLSVARDTFFFPGEGQSMTYVDYANREGSWAGKVLDGIRRYTIGLPSRVVDVFGEKTARRDTALDEDAARGLVVYPNEEEEKAIEALAENVGVSIDPETGIMTIAATAGYPVLAAEMTESFITHLSDRIRVIRTEKERQNLDFIRTRFEEAKQKLTEAEQKLARFNDRNQDITSASLRTERERLQRQVQFASDLYSELQAKVTQAEIDLKRSEPVITILEHPAPPPERSAPQRTLIMLVTFVLAGVVALGVAALNSFFLSQTESPKEGEKIREIRERLLPQWFQTNGEDDEPSMSEEVITKRHEE